MKGREPQGLVTVEELPALQERLVRELTALRGPDGTPLRVDVLDPKVIYREVRGDPPDLMFYFGELRWRSAGTLGHPTLFLKENDTGPDDAVHGFDGVFLLYDPRRPEGRDIGPQKILDVMPTLLHLMGEEIPPKVQGRVMDPFLTNGS